MISIGKLFDFFGALQISFENSKNANLEANQYLVIHMTGYTTCIGWNDGTKPCGVEMIAISVERYRITN